MEEFTVTSKGQVTIPRNIRQKLGIHAGSRVRFWLEDDIARLEVVAPMATDVKSGFGMLRSRRKSVPVDFDPASLLKP